MPLHDSIIEITTSVPKGGCPIRCTKYCPQELIDANYCGDRWMTKDIFGTLIKDIPSSQCLSFCGFSEPFLNQYCIDMIEYAYKKGHPIEICSTLVGMTEDQARRLIKIPISYFLLHHPDFYNNAKIPSTEKYWRVKNIIEHGIEWLADIRMSATFRTVHVENMARNPKEMKKYKGKRICRFMDNINYVMMPNGDLFYCCMTRGLSDKVGNLHETPYPKLALLHPVIARKMQNDPDSICHICPASTNYYIHKCKQMKDKILSGKSLKKVIFGDYVN
jgi:hypothetical protein